MLPANRYKWTHPALAPVSNNNNNNNNLIYIAPACRMTSEALVSWYSIYLPRKDGRLSWPRLPGNAPAGSRTGDLSITSQTPEPCTKPSSCPQFTSQVTTLAMTTVIRRRIYFESRSEISMRTIGDVEQSLNIIQCINRLFTRGHSQKQARKLTTDILLISMFVFVNDLVGYIGVGAQSSLWRQTFFARKYLG